jgi:hypothetical protein
MHRPVVDPPWYDAMHFPYPDADLFRSAYRWNAGLEILRFFQRGESVRREDPCTTPDWLAPPLTPASKFLWSSVSGWQIPKRTTFLFGCIKRLLGRAFRSALTAARNPTRNGGGSARGHVIEHIDLRRWPLDCDAILLPHLGHVTFLAKQVTDMECKHCKNAWFQYSAPKTQRYRDRSHREASTVCLSIFIQ